jgi:hypothetical protein
MSQAAADGCLFNSGVFQITKNGDPDWYGVRDGNF